jgi:hypothetical protein
MREFPFSRRAGWVLGVLALVGAVGFVGLRTERLPSIQLADGSVLSVVAVEVGTNSVYPLEPRWRRYLRRVCPNQWEVRLLGRPPIAPIMGSRRDSLFVWLKHFGTDGKPSVAREKWAQLLSSLVEGKPDEGVPSLFNTSLGVACLEFRTYARNAKRVPLKAWNGTNVVPIEVTNPRPTSPARWRAGPLPQTNCVAGSDIILEPLQMYGPRGPDYIDPRLSVRSRGAERAGWMEWHVTAMDPWGNWTEAGWPARTERPLLKTDGLHGDVWRIQANGVEYLSAGFVPPLTIGTTVVIPVSLRNKEFGVRYLVAIGAGEYRIWDGGATHLEKSDVGKLSGTTMWITTSAPGSWQANLLNPYPGILCVTDKASQHRARLRNRSGRNGGGNIWPASSSWEDKGRQLTFHFFSRNLPAVAREELEVEVFGPLPPVEYLIPSPRTPEWSATESNRIP